MPIQCITEVWLNEVATRLGIAGTELPDLAKIKVSKSKKKCYKDEEDETTSPSIGSDDYCSQSDSGSINDSVESNNNEVILSGGFSNINDYLQNMVKEAMLSHQLANNEETKDNSIV